MTKITRPAQQHAVLGLIDDKIADLEKEIARLAIARSVFVELNPPKTMVWKEIEGPFITPRQWNKLNLKRAQDERAKMKRKSPRTNAPYKGYVADQILKAMDRIASSGPADSHIIWKVVKEETPDLPIKRVWNTLYVLTKQGKVIKEGKLYRLASYAEQQAVTPVNAQ